jgi:hypothetical protein
MIRKNPRIKLVGNPPKFVQADLWKIHSDVVECGTLAENPTTTIEGGIVRKKNVFTTNMRWRWLQGGYFPI